MTENENEKKKFLDDLMAMIPLDHEKEIIELWTYVNVLQFIVSKLITDEQMTDNFKKLCQEDTQKFMTERFPHKFKVKSNEDS